MKESITFIWTLISICIPLCLIVAANDCKQSIPTLAVVNACPESKVNWEKAEEKKQCYQITQNCTTPEKFTYHCLPNKSLDHLVEVCAPVQNIVGHHCSFYDMGKNSVKANFHQSCKKHEIPCPKFYLSNSSFEYQGCYKTVRRKVVAYPSTNCSETPPDILYSTKDNDAITVILIIVVIILVGGIIYWGMKSGLFCKNESPPESVQDENKNNTHLISDLKSELDTQL